MNESRYRQVEEPECVIPELSKPVSQKEAYTQRAYSSRGPQISSHLVGLNSLMKRKVSPIHRDEVNRLMTSGNSVFEPPKAQTGRHILEESSNFINTSEEMKETSNDKMTLTNEEGSQELPEDTTLSEDDQPVDENIEMERIGKMNFYAFKSNSKEGIVGMCQDIKKSKSPHKKPKLSSKPGNNMSTKYKSFLNKSMGDCANLVISNALLKSKKIDTSGEKLLLTKPIQKHCHL